MRDIRFSPSPRGNTYISVHYHQKISRPVKNKKSKKVIKSNWDVEAEEEFKIFCRADIPDGPPKNNCTELKSCPKEKDCPTKRSRRWKSGRFLYSFKNKADVAIGMRGERFARFDGNDDLKEWHGYPILKPVISKDLIQYWRDNDLISDSTKRKLEKMSI